jgi:dTDP-4-amino-4,6-dideoxygalactose transaminase
MSKIIPYGKQKILKRDFKAINEALKADFITGGKYVEKFEKDFCFYTKSKYAVSCSSGTAAIHLALESINICKNDVIIIPAINFIAAANMSKKLGAKIYLADVDPILGQMTPKNLLDCIKQNKIKKLKAFFSMYNGGNPNFVKEFFKIKKKYNSFFLEDACHALGAKYSIKEKLKVGDCKYSDIALFSFHPVKSITTGEGGMITTSNNSIYERCKRFRNHGIMRRKNTKKKYYWKYEIQESGYNYRLSDLNSALGSSQLKNLDRFIQKRKKISEIYNKKLRRRDEIITLPKISKNQTSAWHLYIININFNKLEITREDLIQKLYEKKIITQVHYIPTYKQPVFLKLKTKKLVNSLKYYNSSVSLPIYVDLTIKDQVYIVKNLLKIINDYKK